MPILYYVPMIHMPQELGSLKDEFLAAKIKACGEKAALKFLEEVERYWQEAEKRIRHAGLYRPAIASRLHIFVDGLPNTEKTVVKKIVEELISLKIPVYLIIKTLRENGAVVHGTEKPELILEEHRYWTEISRGKPHNPAIAQKLLRDRDQAIAERIGAVLLNEEIGILFLGRAHDVISELNKLPQKIKIVNL